MVIILVLLYSHYTMSTRWGVHLRLGLQVEGARLPSERSVTSRLQSENLGYYLSKSVNTLHLVLFFGSLALQSRVILPQFPCDCCSINSLDYWDS